MSEMHKYPLKIAIISHLKYPISEPFAGGLEMHTHMLAQDLRDRGHNVTLFAAEKSDARLGLEAICPATELDNVNLEEVRDVAFFKEHHAYLHLMQRLRHASFDIVHNNSLHYLPLSFADLLPMPMVTTLHTPPFCWLESGFRTALGGNNTVVAISNTLAALWRGRQRIDRVILNGIDLERFRFYPKPAPVPYLIWYGRIVPEKGLHYALDAALLLGQAIHVAGPILDNDYFKIEIIPRLQALGCEVSYANNKWHIEGGLCTYLGHVPHERLAQLIGGAQASLCTPCWEEPYGLVVVEALASGTPVAGFRRGALPELLDEKSGALAKDFSAQGLADAVLQAQLCNRYDCRQRAEAIADRNMMILAYESLYYELVRGPDVGHPYSLHHLSRERAN